MSEVTQRLKSDRVYKGLVVKREEGALQEHGYRQGVKLCLDRARLLTESYKETEGEPEILRRAKALVRILENMTIYILDGECIVGNMASSPGAIPLHPEHCHKDIDWGITSSLGDMLDDKGKEEWREISRYWEGKSMDDRVRAILPDELKDYVDWNGVLYSNHFGLNTPVTVPDYVNLFKLGLNGIIKQAEAKLNELKARQGDLSPADYINKRYFYQAVIITLQATINFAHRFANLARELAKSENDAARKQELEGIAEICDWVPGKPPRTLHEALQSWYFIHLIHRRLENQGHCEGTRFDQVMNPFYIKDLEEGKLTRERAQELLEHLWIKLEDFSWVPIREVHGAESGGTMFQTMDLGGVTPEGDDASNEMSFLMLDATLAIRTIQPTFALRYHSKINPALIDKAIDLLATGIGFPAIFNDNHIIPYLVNRGIPLKDARDYSIYGCVSWTIPGKNMYDQVPGTLSLLKCFELALYQGFDIIKERQIGYRTPDPGTFTCIEDVLDAYAQQVWFAVNKMAQINLLAEPLVAQYVPVVFVSATIPECIEKGVDIIQQTYHSNPHCLAAGAINVGDSLAAIKKFVLDDKVLSMKKLIEALRNNFEGQEELRQRLIREAPKFGNDDDYVDLLAREAHLKAQEAAQKVKDSHGRGWSLSGDIAAGYYPLGRTIGATPDGRKRKQTMADGSVSPYPGRDKKGPTAVINSMGKIPATYALLGNQRFMPAYLEGENKKLFAAYLKTWSDLPTWHIQFNVIDDKTLVDAQEYPENHRDLIVRVAGYSATFVDLSKGVQDEIIARTCQRF